MVPFGVLPVFLFEARLRLRLRVAVAPFEVRLHSRSMVRFVLRTFEVRLRSLFEAVLGE